MRRLLVALILVSLSLAVAGGVSAKTSKETIHLTAPKGVMHLNKAMATAQVTYLKHDVTIKITADGLPAASMIHNSKYYVAWLGTTSGKTIYLGVLKVTGTMAGLSAMPMVTSFHSIFVTAETSKHPMHAMGTKVLSGMSMMH